MTRPESPSASSPSAPAEMAALPRNRRRLLMRTLAVPLVATVHPGVAFAAASSLRCLGRYDPPPDPVTTAPDGFVRVVLTATTKPNKAPKFYVSGTALAEIPGGADLVPAGSYISFDTATNIADTSSVLSAEELKSGGYNTIVETPAEGSDEYRAALLLFDTDGRLSSFGAGPGDAASTSCLATFLQASLSEG